MTVIKVQQFPVMDSSPDSPDSGLFHYFVLWDDDNTSDVLLQLYVNFTRCGFLEIWVVFGILEMR